MSRWILFGSNVRRAIAASKAPVVSAVGHEIDFTIADFVADVRAPTPSAAAEMLVPEQREIMQRIDDLQSQLSSHMHAALQHKTKDVNYLQQRLQSWRPEQQLATASTKLQALSAQLQNRINTVLSSASAEAKALESRLQEISQSRYQITPRYQVVETEGPDHARRFTVDAVIQSETVGTGSGRSKQAAEKQAAKQALERLELANGEAETN